MTRAASDRRRAAVLRSASALLAMRRRGILCAVAAGVLLMLLGGPLVYSQDPPAGAPGGGPRAEADDPGRSAQVLMQPALSSIDRGLEFLATRQLEDGSFGPGGYGRNPAVCALAGMAFLASGSTPGRGPYGAHIDRVTNFLVEHTEESGFINVDGSTSHGPMYGHGFAALFLAEVYGMSRRDDLKDKLTRALELIVRTQNAEGGWRYQPVKADADLSVTICQVMALRAGRNAGIAVPSETIDLCIDYVRRSQNDDGGFSYMLQSRGSAFPRSAAGVVALYSAGIYEGPELERGLAYLDRFLPQGNTIAPGGHAFYGQYYAAQAMWHAGDARWAQWYPAIRDVLIQAQRPDGSWADSIGPEYATAMSCIVLQIPNNCVPIFQR